MTILDLIKKSAVMLNIQEVLDDDNLSDINADNEQTYLDSNFALKRLYEFVKIVLNEISSYLPKVSQINIKTIDQKIALNNLTQLSKIIGVKKELGYVKYTIVDNSIKLDEDGIYTVIYKQYPKIDSLLNEIDIYSDMLGEDVFVYGLNSYYCLATGLFNEFNIYNAHYSERLNNLKNPKLFSMPVRSWQW